MYRAEDEIDKKQFVRFKVLIQSVTMNVGSNLAALDALGSKLFFITFCTIDVVLLGDKTLSSDGVLAGAADEALLVPLPSLVLHLLHTCRPRMCEMKSTFVTLHLLTGLEDISTSVTSGGELSVIARSTVDSVRL